MMVFVCFLLSVVAGEYQEREGYIGWELTNAAFCESSTIADWSCQNCLDSGYSLTNITVHDNKGSRGFWGFDAKTNSVIVSFRGSNNTINWISNLDTIAVNYPYCDKCLVHAGFYRSWKQINELTINSIVALQAQHAASTIRIYGHSLGGAMAVHCAAELFAKGYEAQWFYTYGSPRVGNKYFANWLTDGAPHNRVTHARDVVPQLPPRGLLLTFTHIAQEIFYPDPEPDRYTECDGTGEDPNCSNGEKSTSFDDHMYYMGSHCCCPSQR
jgi:predicted lipase